jgi:acyl-coenzyme A synthetase/AMP-(fatty) acid ligase
VLAWALTPWAYLACGAQVIVPSRAPEAPGPRVAHWFAEQDATLAAVSPMLATSFLTSPDAERSTLRTLLVHGVGVPTLPLRRGSRMNVFREYVIAEAGGLVLSSRVRAGDAGDTPFASESPAALGAQAYVLDAHGRLLTPGAVGELHLGGTGIARGYAGEPERTARTFVPDPLGADPGARLVRTGDLARRRLDGSLELLGRTQDEVRFRGFRLNPCLEELEQALAEHPSVAAAAAGWDAEDELLIGYVVSRRGLAPEPAELDAWLQQRVADWTLPGRYVAIPSLPLRPDGSLDRAALGELTERQPLGDEDPARTAPRTRVEKKLQAVWKKVLGRRDVGVHDSFFALGGDLALGIEMVERAGAAGIAVSTEGLMFRPTIAELAAVAERSS